MSNHYFRTGSSWGSIGGNLAYFRSYAVGKNRIKLGHESAEMQG